MSLLTWSWSATCHSVPVPRVGEPCLNEVIVRVELGLPLAFALKTVLCDLQTMLH